MRSRDAATTVAKLTARQWGMVTTKQASSIGVSRLDLSRLAAAGHLTRISHGVYQDSGTPGDEFDDLRAAWLSTKPAQMADDRIRQSAKDVVVSGESACRLHGFGDFWAERHEFSCNARKQSQREEIRYRIRKLTPADVTIAQGLPTTSPERTIADIADSHGDMSLVADVLCDAAKQRHLDTDRLSTLLAPLAKRHGFAANDGNALLAALRREAGLDAESVAARIAATPDISFAAATRALEDIKQRLSDGEYLSLPEIESLVRLADAAGALTQNLFPKEAMAAILRPLFAPETAQTIKSDLAAMSPGIRAILHSLYQAFLAIPATLAGMPYTSAAREINNSLTAYHHALNRSETPEEADLYGHD